jgi:hypothetical protein
MAARNAQASTPGTEPAKPEEPIEAVEAPKEDSKKSYTVVGALAIVKGTDGKVKYLYRGSEVPEGVSAEEIARLAELGLVEAGADVVPGLAVKPE